MAKGFLRDGGVGMKTGCESLGMDLDERAGVGGGGGVGGFSEVSRHSFFWGFL